MDYSEKVMKGEVNMKGTLKNNSIFKFIIVVLLPVLAVIICHNAMPSYYSMMISLFLINVILTASLNLTNGFTGIFNIGQAGFMAIGAYISSLLTMEPNIKAARISGLPQWIANIHIPFPAAIIIAGVIAMLIAMIIGFPVLRARGDYLSVITLGLVIIIKAVIDNNPQITNGSKGLGGIKGYATLPVIFIVTILVLFILYRIMKSSFGRNMVAIRDDEPAAVSLGINVTRYRLLSFMISAFFGAIGGGLWAHLYKSIAPSFFYFNESFNIVEMSVLGGMATLSGAIPGALIVTFLPQFLANLESGFTIFGATVPPLYGLSNIIMSLIFILVIIFKRTGITGNSDYIVNSMFDKNTYIGLFKKQTWVDMGNIVKSMFSHKKI